MPAGTSSATRPTRPELGVVLALALAFPAAAGQPQPGALARGADEVAARVAEEAGGPEAIAVQVAAPGADGLALPLAASLSEALSRRGFAVAHFAAATGPGGEEAARILGADRLLRVTAGLVPGRRELVLTAESVPTRPSFFLQRAPAFRSGGGRVWTLSVPADETALLLARAGSRAGPAGPSLWIRPLFKVDDRILALGAGDAAGDGSTSLVLVTPRSVSVLTLGGMIRARYVLDPDVPGPRHPAATVAVGRFGPRGRVAIQRAGSPGLLLEMSGGTLLPVEGLPGAPLSAGDGRALFGAFLPGKATLADVLGPGPDLDGRPRTSREFVAFASAPRAGRVAHAWVSGDGVLIPLGPDLEPAGPPIEGVGSGVALADVDGDGEPEVVASAPETGTTDRVRVLRWSAGGPASPPTVVLESAPLPGSILAGAAADLTGDGVDDAVVAAVLPGGGSELWMVTSDPRFAEAQ